MSTYTERITQATKHLQKDPVLAPLIATYGQCPIAPHTNYYQALVESIVGQQLSVKAAASIRRRFVELFDGTFPSPSDILNKSVEELRSAGLSGAKAKYVQDLARHIQEDKLRFDEFEASSNDEIIRKLTAVKGIGEWTAHMFLMFCMARLDVLPVGDLGIKNGIRALYAFDTLPTAADITLVAEQNNWHPYESVASWYIWQSLDNSPKL